MIALGITEIRITAEFGHRDEVAVVTDLPNPLDPESKLTFYFTAHHGTGETFVRKYFENIPLKVTTCLTSH